MTADLVLQTAEWWHGGEPLTETASLNDSSPLSLSKHSACFRLDRPFSRAVSKLANILGSFCAKTPTVPTPLTRYKAHSICTINRIIITTVTSNIIVKSHEVYQDLCCRSTASHAYDRFLGRTEYQLLLMKISWRDRNVKIRYKSLVVIDEFLTVLLYQPNQFNFLKCE